MVALDVGALEIIRRVHGLLPQAKRSEAGYRVYDEGAAQQLRFVKKAQGLGFSLDEIRRILNLRGDGKNRCRCVVSSMAEATLSETERKMGELRKLRDGLRKNLRTWRTLPHRATAAEFCGLIENA
jgi:DNA-binding transcriptional MerR regulator